MTALQWLFDSLLIGTLVGLAWRSLASTELFKAVVLFIAFGLLMALAWGTVPLVTLAGRAALIAGMRYLITTVLASFVYLLGVALLYGAYATFDIGMLGRRMVPNPVT